MAKGKKQGVDARGKTLRVNDRVMYKDGKIHEVAASPRNLRRGGAIHATPIDHNPPFILLRLDKCLKVRRNTENGSRKRWKAAWVKYVKPLKRKAARKRKRVSAMPKKLCPVCEVVWFRLGIPVWRGKKLRVCARPCRREVSKEVRLAIEYGVEKKKARRKAARKFMKRGDQL